MFHNDEFDEQSETTSTSDCPDCDGNIACPSEGTSLAGSSSSFVGRNFSSMNMNTSFTGESSVSSVHSSPAFHTPAHYARSISKVKESPMKSPLTESVVIHGKKSQKTLICGVQVEFPCTPYPVQLSMMSQVLQAIKKAQNCLLESPTGTGKTLALLCSALAWQKQEKETERQILKAAEELAKESSSTKSALNTKEVGNNAKSTSHINDDSTKENITLTPDSDSDEDIFQSPKRKKKSPSKLGGNEKKIESLPATAANILEEEKQDIYEDAEEQIYRVVSTTKIYYGTRTHKQIAQVVEQLRKTKYGEDVRMTVLAAREHTCINNMVRNKPNMNDLCQTLIEKLGGCTYYNTSMRFFDHERLKKDHLPPVFDVEDMVKHGSRKKICPYFLLRALESKAEIVFCPYNYLIDPKIRDSMNIDLSKSILIMDEAHNIEDVCRAAGSLLLQQNQLADAIKDAKENIKRGMNPEQYTVIEDYLQMLYDWLHKYGTRALFTDTEASSSWSGEEIISLLEIEGITKEKFQSLKDSMDQISTLKQEFPDDNSGLTGIVKAVCSNLRSTFEYIYELKNTNKYQAFLSREMHEEQAEPGSWLSKHRKHQNEGRVWKYTLNLLCLSPTIVFSELLVARTIVLASGTLSPLESFQAELSASFPVVVRGRHVVPSENLFVSILPKGPNNQEFKGVFENVNKYEYQDQLGKAILETSKIVPHGVLCFLPSYSLMDKLRGRWTSTGLLNELINMKDVFFEPRNKLGMSDMMEDFSNSIQTSKTNGDRGGIMFGVFRGKIAEGIDFNDDNARVVIVVGIPFLNRTKMEINLKMKFNDKNKQPTTLDGNQWYRIQAYRALNQALGRGIRHKDDWGAIILLDARFTEMNTQKNLPKWIQQQIVTYSSWESYLKRIEAFCTRMKEKHSNSSASTTTT